MLVGPSLDDLICPEETCLGHHEMGYLGGLEVENQLRSAASQAGKNRRT
jgi:hypothetical protein